MLQTILRLAYCGILPMQKAIGQLRGGGEMYFNKSWPLSFELQTNPAHFPGLWQDLPCSQPLRQGLLSQPGPPAPREATLGGCSPGCPLSQRGLGLGGTMPALLC